MKLFFSLFLLIIFTTNFAMKNDQITYHKEHYNSSRPQLIRISARCNGQEVGCVVPYENLCNRVGKLWVADHMRKKGIAKEMLLQFADYCKKKNWESVDGFVDPTDSIKGYFEKLAKTYPITMAYSHPLYLYIEFKCAKNDPIKQ